MTRIGRNVRVGRSTRLGRHVVVGTPLTILGANLLQWCRADQGVTLATGVSQWDDLSGNGRHYTQATGSAQPAYGATAGPNSTPAITFDGTDDILRSTLGRPAPGTVPTWAWIVLKQVTFVNQDRIFCAGNSSSILTLVQVPGPGLATYNGTTSGTDTNQAIGAWGAVTTYFSNSTADYIQVNDLPPTTGVNVGNNSAATGMTIGAGNSTLYSNISIAEVVFADVLPTADQLAAFSAYRQFRYGF